MSQIVTDGRSSSTNLEADGVQFGAPPPVLFAASLLSGLLLNRFLPIPLVQNRLGRPAGAIVTMMGLALGGAAVREMSHAGNSPEPGVPVRAVVSGGPYRFTRNPMYVGMSLMVAGLSLVARTAWPLFLLPTAIALVTELAIRREEAYLEGKFHDSYGRYKAQVRRWI